MSAPSLQHHGRGIFLLDQWPQVPVDPEDLSKGTRDATPHEAMNLPQRWVIIGQLADGTYLAESGLNADWTRRGKSGDPWEGMPEPVASGHGHGARGRYERLPEELKAQCFKVRVVRHRGQGKPGVKRSGPPPRSVKGEGPLIHLDHRGPDQIHLVKKALKDEHAEIRRICVGDLKEEDLVVDLPGPAVWWTGELEP